MALQSSDLFVVQSLDKKSWKLSFNKLQAAIEGGSGINFRGQVDLNVTPNGQLNPDPPVNGDLYLVSSDADPIFGLWDMANGVTAAKKNDRIVYDSVDSKWVLVQGGSSTEGVVIEVKGAEPIIVNSDDPTKPIVSIRTATIAESGAVVRLATSSDVDPSIPDPSTTAVVTADLLHTTNSTIETVLETLTLDAVLTNGNVSDKNIELTNGNDLIHLTPNENRVLIAGSALSDTPRLVLANADNNIATDNQFTLQLGDSSTKAEFTSSANITHYDFKFNNATPSHSFFSNGNVVFIGQAELKGGVKYGDGTEQNSANIDGGVYA